MSTPARKRLMRDFKRLQRISDAGVIKEIKVEGLFIIQKWAERFQIYLKSEAISAVLDFLEHPFPNTVEENSGCEQDGFGSANWSRGRMTHISYLEYKSSSPEQNSS